MSQAQVLPTSSLLSLSATWLKTGRFPRPVLRNEDPSSNAYTWMIYRCSCARKAIESISIWSLQVPTATLAPVYGEEEREIESRLLQYGDIFKVTLDCRTPTDGTVLSGSSEVDGAIITGEPGAVENNLALLSSLALQMAMGDCLSGSRVYQITIQSVPSLAWSTRRSSQNQSFRTWRIKWPAILFQLLFSSHLPLWSSGSLSASGLRNSPHRMS